VFRPGSRRLLYRTAEQRDDPKVAERDRGEALAPYVVDDAAEAGPREHCHHGLQPGAIHQSLAAVNRAAHDLSERLTVPASIGGGSESFECLRAVVHITRHLVMPPPDAVRAFDWWLAGAGDRITTKRGSLRLVSPSPGPSQHGSARLRAVGGRLSFRLSPAPLPVELELVPWGEWRTVLTLHPDHRFGRTVGSHGRSRYFAAGHATMDVIVHRLRAQEAEPADHPYDAGPCGLWSSTRIPATTA